MKLLDIINVNSQKDSQDYERTWKWCTGFILGFFSFSFLGPDCWCLFPSIVFDHLCNLHSAANMTRGRARAQDAGRARHTCLATAFIFSSLYRLSVHVYIFIYVYVYINIERINKIYNIFFLSNRDCAPWELVPMQTYFL